MDKVADSGSADAGSIPARGARKIAAFIIEHYASRHFLHQFCTNPIIFLDFLEYLLIHLLLLFSYPAVHVHVILWT